MYKATEITVLLVLVLAITACGSPSSGNINGNWTATLANADGSVAYRFSATLARGTDSVLNVTNLTFTTPGPCMSAAEPATGSFTPTSGAFALSMASPDVGGPLMSLEGTLSDSGISGTWSASVVLLPCSGNGTFTMQRSVAG